MWVRGKIGLFEVPRAYGVLIKEIRVWDEHHEFFLKDSLQVWWRRGKRHYFLSHSSEAPHYNSNSSSSNSRQIYISAPSQRYSITLWGWERKKMCLFSFSPSLTFSPEYYRVPILGWLELWSFLVWVQLLLLQHFSVFFFLLGLYWSS